MLHARELNRQPGMAVHHGLNASYAIPSVTSVPASAMGLGDRVGLLAVGHDGDVVVWNTHPLASYALAKVVVRVSMIFASFCC